MDGNQFDAISRALAGRTSRRRALQRASGGGVTAGLLGAFGLWARAAAQDDDVAPEEEGDVCILDFIATVRLGPSAESPLTDELTGELRLPIGRQGGIDSGTLTLDDGTELPVVGHTSGRAVNLRIEVDEDRALVAVGVGEWSLRACRGVYSGPATGPQEGDLGDWKATATGGSQTGDGAGTPTATTPADPDDNDPDPEPPATQTPCPPTDCGGTFILDPVTCECGCPSPSERCADSCCPAGAICNEAAGSCACPDGTEICNETCTPSCPQGQTLNFNTCLCVADEICNPIACTAPQVFDPVSCQCKCPAGQDFCNGACMSITSDTSNCGFCGNVCPPGMPCIGGTCQCPFSYNYCQGAGCKDLSADVQNCGTCGNACGLNEACVGGDCQ